MDTLTYTCTVTILVIGEHSVVGLYIEFKASPEGQLKNPLSNEPLKNP